MANTNDSTNVTLGRFKVGGYIYWAPRGTPLPTDSATPLSDAFKIVGFLNEDGVTNTTDTDTTEVTDANGTTIMKVISSYAESYQFVLLETLNVEAAKLRYGSDKVTGQDKSMTIKHAMPSDEDFIVVLELVRTGGVLGRIVIGVATRAEFGDRQEHIGDASAYDVTIAANDMGGGVTSIEYIGVPAPAQGGKAAAAAQPAGLAEPPTDNPTIKVSDEEPAAQPAPAV